MWIVRLALRRPYTFVVVALLILSQNIVRSPGTARMGPIEYQEGQVVQPITSAQSGG